MSKKSFVKYLIAFSFFVAALLFFLNSIFSSDSLDYDFVRSERAVVTSSVGPPSKSRASHPSVMIKVESGIIVRLMVPASKNYEVGEVVKVDQFKAKGRKPVYRLAAEPIAP